MSGPSRSWLSAPTLAVAVITVAASALAGIAPGALPLAGTLVLAALAVGALTAVLLRRVLSMETPGGPAVESTTGDSAKPEAGDLRLSRFLFYLGTLAIGQSGMRLGFGLTVAECLLILAFIGCLFGALRGSRIVSLPPLIVAGACIFAFGGALSSISAQDPTASGTEVLHAVYVTLLWFWTAAMVLRTREHVLTAISLWVVSVAVDGVGAIMQVAGFGALTGPLEGHRATSFSFHPNDLGEITGIALVPGLLLATRSGTERSMALLRWLLVGLIGAGLVLSGSVAGMAAAVVGILFWLSSPSVRAPGRVAVVAAVAVSLVVGGFVGSRVTSPAKRVVQVTSRTGTEEGSGSGEARLKAIEAIWPRIESNPVVGTGLDAGGKAVTIIHGGRTETVQLHGAPAVAWYQTGIFGLIGFVVTLGAIAGAGWRALQAAESEDDHLIIWSLLAAFVAFVVNSLSGPWLIQQYGWLTGALIVAWSCRRDVRLRARDVGWQPPGPQFATPQLLPR